LFTHLKFDLYMITSHCN